MRQRYIYVSHPNVHVLCFAACACPIWTIRLLDYYEDCETLIVCCVMLKKEFNMKFPNMNNKMKILCSCSSLLFCANFSCNLCFACNWTVPLVQELGAVAFHLRNSMVICLDQNGWHFQRSNVRSECLMITVDQTLFPPTYVCQGNHWGNVLLSLSS